MHLHKATGFDSFMVCKSSKHIVVSSFLCVIHNKARFLLSVHSFIRILSNTTQVRFVV